jgi:epoxyqueuosine reductase
MALLSAQFIKEEAIKGGFSFCGISKNEMMPVAKYYFVEAISKGYHDQMGYLERDIEGRFTPEHLLPGCKSVIVALFNYNNGKELHSKYKISKYAFIKDYHVLIHDHLQQFVNQLKKEYPTLAFKCTVDASSISEKNWAVHAGLGHYGKNGVILTPLGSYFFIGLILIDQEVDFYDQPTIDGGCGSCSICMDRCPTQAIVSPFVIDAKKCLSYQTLSNKTPDFDLVQEHPWIFGCDVCQDVCPKNKKSVVNELAVNNSSLFLHFEDKDFENLTKEAFSLYFQGSPILGKNYEKLLQFIKNRQKWKI